MRISKWSIIICSLVNLSTFSLFENIMYSCLYVESFPYCNTGLISIITNKYLYQVLKLLNKILGPLNHVVETQNIKCVTLTQSLLGHRLSSNKNKNTVSPAFQKVFVEVVQKGRSFLLIFSIVTSRAPSPCAERFSRRKAKISK